MLKCQVKYCYSEKELNEFLLGLNLGKDCPTPYLQNIQYTANMHIKGKKDVVDGTSDVIAIVHYIIDVEVARINDVSSVFSVRDA